MLSCVEFTSVNPLSSAILMKTSESVRKHNQQRYQREWRSREYSSRRWERLEERKTRPCTLKGHLRKCLNIPEFKLAWIEVEYHDLFWNRNGSLSWTFVLFLTRWFSIRSRTWAPRLCNDAKLSMLLTRGETLNASLGSAYSWFQIWHILCCFPPVKDYKSRRTHLCFGIIQVPYPSVQVIQEELYVSDNIHGFRGITNDIACRISAQPPHPTLRSRSLHRVTQYTTSD